MIAGEFAVVTREELWSLAERPTLLERRLIHGVAVQRGSEIVASDQLDGECERACSAAMESARSRVFEAAAPWQRDRKVRITASSRREGGLFTETVCVLSWRWLSVVSDPDHLVEDAALLERFEGRRASTGIDYRAVPIVWRNGSAAVLFHEAVGHAAELGHEAIDLPAGFQVDAPLEMRRASFTDVPGLRMRHVRVVFQGTPIDPPPRRIDVHLVSGGHYEALTGRVTIQVGAADLIRGDIVTALEPFTIVEHRRDLMRSIRGAFGPSVRYPGVVCSREGQELIVPSYAPLVVTEH